MPNNFGNCVLARTSATPHLNPINSEMAEVTEMVVGRELQNSQKTSPPNMHA